MASATPASALPDYVLDPNAVMKDSEATWRYKKAPNYTKTRAFYGESEYLQKYLRLVSPILAC